MLSTHWSGPLLVDSEHFDEIYAGPTATHYYCFPEETCLYFLIKDSAGNGLDQDGHYEVKYGPSQALTTVASGNEFEYIRAHFVGGPSSCSKQ